MTYSIGGASLKNWTRPRQKILRLFIEITLKSFFLLEAFKGEKQRETITANISTLDFRRHEYELLQRSVNKIDGF